LNLLITPATYWKNICLFIAWDNLTSWEEEGGLMAQGNFWLFFKSVTTFSLLDGELISYLFEV